MGTGITDTTGTVNVTVGDAELHAVQITVVMVKPGGTSEEGAWLSPAPGTMKTVVVYGIVV